MPRSRARTLHLLFAASGGAALIYQILWVRAFANVFGATAEAVAAILAAFFLGLAFGSDFFGRLADRSRRPLRLYALMELGIAIGALPVFAFLALYRSLYDELYPLLAAAPGLLILFKMALTTAALFPATAFMGGTLPALGRALVGDAGDLGARGSRLYAANIVGAVIGTLLATFGLPLWFGVRLSYALAIALSLAIAGVAGWLARHEVEQPPAVAPPSPEPAAPPPPGSRRLLAIAFGSGFATLALQLLWTRMFALVLQNSVYSFGSVVAVFLAGLALGAALVASLLKRYPPQRVLRVSLLITAVLVLATPAVLLLLSGGLEPRAAHGSWLGFAAGTVGLAAAVTLIPISAAGMTLPCVWELWRERPGAGSRLGRPTAVNTLGAILGPLAAGFLALPTLGLGASIAAVGALYFVMGELAVPRGARPRFGGWERAAVYPAALALWLVLPPISLPLAKLGEGERLLWAKEGARGAVAVVERERDRRIKLDNHYAIGGSRVVVEERRQGHLPLLLHPDPRRVAFIGMGTGITAGAALAHPRVERVVIMELVPEVIEAARDYFRAWNDGVVDDPRVEVIAEDGRNHLAGTDERFDVIVGDLFVPWREGVGALYTRDHFETVKAHLRPGGLFAQWLPLWQLSRREFDIVAATFLSVFDHAMLWRGVFSPVGSSLALVAFENGEPPVDLGAVAKRLGKLRAGNPFSDGFLSDATGFMLLYAGDLSSQTDRLATVGINSDDRPRIEWLAPRTLHAVERGEARWLSGAELADLYDAINRAPSTPSDRLLESTPRPPRVYREAGARFYRAEVLAAAGQQRRAQELRREAYRLLGFGEPPGRSGGSPRP
jgi:spermidine synthase